MEGTDILSRIPGEYVAEAGKGLPDVRTTKGSEIEATLEVPGHGRVVFTFRRMNHKRGRSTHTWWAATAARAAPSG
jgi:hypothetical protein